MRTYSRSDWDRAQREWEDFSYEWHEVRHRAAMRGILFPPAGTRWDSWEDDTPSQRAMLIRAIRETPETLDAAIARSRSWTEVIARVIGRRDEMRLEAEEHDLEIARRRAEEPSHPEAVKTLKLILDRISDS